LGKAGYVHSKYLEYSSTTSKESFDTPKQEKPYFLIGFCVIIALLISFFVFIKEQDRKMLKTVTELNRGTRSERDLVLKLLKYGMPTDIIFHDLYLKKQNGGFSQIDLVAVTDFGIIVFEVKDYSGWLYGTGNQQQWTKVLAYGKQKYRFYNPILQNNKHVTELKKQLIQVGDLPFYSIVVFYGNCVLKEINYVPNGTFLVKSERALDAMKTIFKENKPVHYTNRDEVFLILKEAVTNGKMIENQTQHKENIKDMLGKHRIFD
jgi:Nuclease-related domain